MTPIELTKYEVLFSLCFFFLQFLDFLNRLFAYHRKMLLPYFLVRGIGPTHQGQSVEVTLACCKERCYRSDERRNIKGVCAGVAI